MEMHRDELDSEGYRQRLQAAKRAIAQGEGITDPAIAPFLVQSWQRSHALGINVDDPSLAGHEQSQFIIDDADRAFSAIVGQDIEAIWESFGGEQWAVYCTNARGIIVRARHGSNPASRAFALHVGRRIQEQDVGTTAPACALQEKVPITLVGAEHYLDEFADMCCCAVPVWGPWGVIIGVLNVTGSEHFKSRLVEHKLASAAVKIENRLFLAAHRRHRVFRIHYEAELIDTHLAGLVAIDAAGDVLSASRSALDMLGSIDLFGQRRNVGQLFIEGFVATGDECRKTQLRNGIVFYTRGCAAIGTHIPTASGSGSLRERSQLHIQDVVRQSGGNISKAAKVLGVSRTTLYRTLNRL